MRDTKPAGRARIVPVRSVAGGSRRNIGAGRRRPKGASPQTLDGKQKARRKAGLEIVQRINLQAEAESAFTRRAKRDTLRDAVFRCSTPFVAARISSGCAAVSAACAAA